MNPIEHKGLTPLLALIDEIGEAGDASWVVACVKKACLKPVTNEAFILAVQPAIQRAGAAHVFFDADKKIYVAWKGEKKAIYQQLRSIVSTNLAQAGLTVEPSALISYLDPCLHGEAFKASLRTEIKKSYSQTSDPCDENKRDLRSPLDPFGWNEMDQQESTHNSTTSLSITPEQTRLFQKAREHRSYRKQLDILVVEDQVFSQKLLCEVIRSARFSGHETVIDAVQSLQEAWRLFLKKAHDIAFIDLSLSDGSGHALSREIKSLDPLSQVIIVTANNYDEELDVARRNNVDGFIAKPYNKKQILDCIDRYVANSKGGRGAAHGIASKLR